jgi:hypothetical protein
MSARGKVEQVDVKDISAVLRIEGGLADEGLLDIHDAANTIYGLARAMNIITHSFANNEQIRTKAATATSVQSFIHSSKKGCFEEQIDIRFDPKVVLKMGSSVIAKNLWDYMAWAWSSAVGHDYEPTSAHLIKILKKDPELVYVMGDALETPMQKLHKAIVRDKNVTIFLCRPHVGDIIKLDKETLDYVSLRNEQTETSYIEGNVTKFNVLSDFGRMYSDVDGKTVSFRLGHQDDRLQSLCLESMQGMVDAEEDIMKMHFKVSKVVSAQGVVKRYVVHDILRSR